MSSHWNVAPIDLKLTAKSVQEILACVQPFKNVNDLVFLFFFAVYFLNNTVDSQDKQTNSTLFAINLIINFEFGTSVLQAIKSKLSL